VQKEDAILFGADRATLQMCFSNGPAFFVERFEKSESETASVSFGVSGWTLDY
jgi:hypothetical protein